MENVAGGTCDITTGGETPISAITGGIGCIVDECAGQENVKKGGVCTEN